MMTKNNKQVVLQGYTPDVRTFTMLRIEPVEIGDLCAGCAAEFDRVLCARLRDIEDCETIISVEAVYEVYIFKEN